MIANKLIERILQQGGALSVEDGQLVLTGNKGIFDDDLLQEIKRNKPAIIETIEQAAADTAAGVTQALPAIRNQPGGGKKLLSFAQQRLWFIDRLDEGSAQYNIPIYFKLSGELNHEAFVCAIETIIDRHEVLRTRFTEVDSTAYQLVLESFSLKVEQVDLSGLGEEQCEAEVLRLARNDAKRPFNLGNEELLIRVKLLKLGEREHVVLLNMHHIAADGWSISIFMNELSALYQAFSQGRPDPLPSLPIQYSDYAQWQRDWLQGETLDRQLAYWREQLHDIPQEHGLPLDHPRPPKQSFAGRSHCQNLNPELSRRVQRFCRQHKVTPFILMHTAFAVLTHRFSREDDIVIGAPIAGRPHADTEGLIGFFVNALVLRLRVDGEASFDQLLGINKQAILDAYTYQHIPFDTLVENLRIERDLRHSPVFQIAIAMDNNQQGELDLGELRLSPLNTGQSVIKFDLELFIREAGDRLRLTWNYNSDLFEAASIEDLAAAFAVLLAGLLDHPEQAVDQLPLMDEAQRRRLIHIHGRRDAWLKRDEQPLLRTITGCFAEQVERNPDAPAVSMAGATLDYRTLDRRAEGLARSLRRRGVTEETLVGVYLPPGVTDVVAQLAVLKAGGAYVPLAELTQAELHDALIALDIAHVISDKRLPVSLAVEAITPDVVGDSDAEPPGDHILESGAHSGHQAACVLYLPGANGDSRVIEIEHATLLELLDDPAYPAATPGRTTLALAADAHDSNSFMRWHALCSGGCYVLCANADAGRYLPDADNVIIGRQALAALAAAEPGALAGAKCLILGAAFDGESLGRIFAAGAPATVYAITEPEGDNGHVSWQRIERINPRGIYPIVLSRRLAREFDHSALYLLDRDLQPVPMGAVGEVYHGGRRLREATEPLLDSPFRLGEKLRKSGDWARWVRTGTQPWLQRLDRIEGAVLIRGKRVSPEAVSEQFKAREEVADCWVTSQLDEENQRRLVAYVVLANGTGDAEDRLRAMRRCLRAILTVYELPSVYVLATSLPRTAGGNIDETQLPHAREHGIEIDAYVPPRNAREETLCAIWCDLLDIDRIGVDDDFFLLGGHSLLATRLISRIRQDMEIELPLRLLFENPTIRTLAEVMDSHGEELMMPAIGKARARALDDESMEGEVF